jgi:hypothetical protein
MIVHRGWSWSKGLTSQRRAQTHILSGVYRPLQNDGYKYGHGHDKGETDTNEGGLRKKKEEKAVRYVSCHVTASTEPKLQRTIRDPSQLECQCRRWPKKTRNILKKGRPLRHTLICCCCCLAHGLLSSLALSHPRIDIACVWMTLLRRRIALKMYVKKGQGQQSSKER